MTRCLSRCHAPTWTRLQGRTVHYNMHLRRRHMTAGGLYRLSLLCKYMPIQWLFIMPNLEILGLLLSLLLSSATVQLCKGRFTNPIDWTIDWLIDWLIDWTIDWLIDWLIDLFIYWAGFLALHVLIRRSDSRWRVVNGSFSLFVKVNVKVWTLVIAPLTWVRLVTSSALQSRKWQLIGMCQWVLQRVMLPSITALKDNWTHGAASRHTIVPISCTRPSSSSHTQCWINPSGALCQHEMGGPSNPLPSLPLPLSFPFPPPFPSRPLEVGPLKYS